MHEMVKRAREKAYVCNDGKKKTEKVKSQNSLIVKMIVCGGMRKRIELLMAWWVCTSYTNVISLRENLPQTYIFVHSLNLFQIQIKLKEDGKKLDTKTFVHALEQYQHAYINSNGTKQCLEIFGWKMELIQTFHVYAVRKINFIKFITSCIWYINT